MNNPEEILERAGFEELSLRSALARARSSSKCIALLIGEREDDALHEIVTHIANSQNSVRDDFELALADRRAEPSVWERYALDLEELTDRFGTPFIGFLGPGDDLFFGAVEVSVRARQDLPGIDQLLHFARTLHTQRQSDNIGPAGPLGPERPSDEVDVDLETALLGFGKELRARQDLRALGFPGRLAPGFAAMRFWLRWFERYGDRGLDVRLSRMIRGMPMLISPLHGNRWTWLGQVIQAARVVAEAEKTLDEGSARPYLIERIEEVEPRSETERAAIAIASATLGADPPRDGIEGLDRLEIELATGGPSDASLAFVHEFWNEHGSGRGLSWPTWSGERFEPIVDWDHASPLSRWLEILTSLDADRRPSGAMTACCAQAARTVAQPALRHVTLAAALLRVQNARSS